MFQRQKLEKEEGKVYSDPGVSRSRMCLDFNCRSSYTSSNQVSSEMKALNRQFGMLHGISSLANLGAIIALGFHGLWIGNAGVKGY